MRLEESTYINSIADETNFFNKDDDDIFSKILQVIETTGKKYIRFIPFDEMWNKFWDSIKKHFFVFENMKAAVVYFYNSETC